MISDNCIKLIALHFEAITALIKHIYILSTFNFALRDSVKVPRRAYSIGFFIIQTLFTVEKLRVELPGVDE